MNRPVKNLAAAILLVAGLSAAACRSTDQGAGVNTDHPVAGSRASARPTPGSFYTPTHREWVQYLKRMEAWMNEDAKTKLTAQRAAQDSAQMRRSGFKFEPSFDQPMPAFDAPAEWDPSYLVLVNTNDEAVKVSINGVPFGTLKPGQRYSLPVTPYTRHVVEYFVPERDITLQQNAPLKLLVRFSRDVR